MNRKIGYIGLGKMGLNMTKRLSKLGFKIIAYDPNPKASRLAKRNGVLTKSSIKNLVLAIPKNRIIFLMVPHQSVRSIVKELLKILSPRDIVIDGGNSYFENSIINHKLLKRRNIGFLDVGISGGPKGALEGACVMVGGDKSVFKKTESIFKNISLPGGYLYVGKTGTGHFAKMIHNGIEYGMMQSLAEGFGVIKKSNFNYDLEKLANLFNTGSVIESRFTKWLTEAYKIYGEDLKNISGVVAHSGEGDWTVKIAKKLKVPTLAIEQALLFRKKSSKKPDYIGKILSALRNRFGGHKLN